MLVGDFDQVRFARRQRVVQGIAQGFGDVAGRAGQISSQAVPDRRQPGGQADAFRLFGDQLLDHPAYRLDTVELLCFDSGLQHLLGYPESRPLRYARQQTEEKYQREGDREAWAH